MSTAERLYTSTDVAKLCQVDTKTIHNWVDRGHIPSFRTPGRHLRFRLADVEAFLRKHGYPVPAELPSGSANATIQISLELATWARDELLRLGCVDPQLTAFDGALQGCVS